MGSDEKIAFAGCGRVKMHAKEGRYQMGATEKETVVEKPQVGGAVEAMGKIRRE